MPTTRPVAVTRSCATTRNIQISSVHSPAAEKLNTPLPEKLPEEIATLFTQQAVRNQHLVIQPGMVHHLEHRSRRACLGVARPVDQPLQPRVNHGASAHRAGL